MSVEKGDLGPLFARVGQIIVLAPFAHLVLTSLFLIGYYAAIRHDVFLFASISDLFSVSIKDVGPVYIGMFILPGAFILLSRLELGAWTDHEVALNQPEGDLRDMALARFRKSKKASLIYLNFMFVLYLCPLLYYSYMSGYVSYMAVFTLIAYVYLFVNMRIHRKLDIPSYWMHATAIGGLIPIFCYFAGLTSGQQDYHISYQVALHSKALCKRFAIIKPVGTNFLAVAQGNRLIIIKPDCEIMATLPKSN